MLKYNTSIAKEKQALNNLLNEQMQAWDPWEQFDASRIVIKKSPAKFNRNIRINQARKKSQIFCTNIISKKQSNLYRKKSPQNPQQKFFIYKKNNSSEKQPSQSNNQEEVSVSLDKKICNQIKRQKLPMKALAFNSIQIKDQIAKNDQTFRISQKFKKFRLSFSDYCSSLHKKPDNYSYNKSVCDKNLEYKN